MHKTYVDMLPRSLSSQHHISLQPFTKTTTYMFKSVFLGSTSSATICMTLIV